MKKVKIEKARLYRCDCLDLLKKLPDKSIDLIVTDPPYEIIDCGKAGGSLGKKGHLDSISKIQENKNLIHYNIKKYNKEFVRVMKKINIYIWCNKLQIVDYIKFYVQKLGCKFTILSWHKTNALPTYHGKYLSDTEYCLYFSKGGRCFPEKYEDAKTYFFDKINIKDKEKWGHPTIKHLYMIERLIKNSSKKGQKVLDPFMGSGTTGVACKNLKRKFIGCEIDKKYFKTCIKRIKEKQFIKLF